MTGEWSSGNAQELVIQESAPPQNRGPMYQYYTRTGHYL